MTRRRRNALLVAGGIVLLLGVAPYVFFHPRRLSHAGFEAVQNGMTQQEVEQLLGGPPGIYYPAYLGAGAGWSKEAVIISGRAAETLWYDDKARYEIWFNNAGRVVAKHKRASWYATTHICRLGGWLFGGSEPTPLEPRWYDYPAGAE